MDKVRTYVHEEDFNLSPKLSFTSPNAVQSTYKEFCHLEWLLTKLRLERVTYTYSHVFAAAIFAFLTGINGSWNMSLMENGEAKLREKLFKTGYNPELRPVLNRSSKVTVKLGVSLHQIIDVVNDLYYSKFEEAYEYAIWFSQLYPQFFLPLLERPLTTPGGWCLCFSLIKRNTE